jgi:hypothetical protein
MVHQIRIVAALVALLVIPGLAQAGPDPQSIDFGGQEVFSGSTAVPLAYTNDCPGQADRIEAFNFGSHPDFSLDTTGATCSDGPLAAGATCSIGSVVYTPEVLEVVRGDVLIDIFCADPELPILEIVGLTGSGLPRPLAFSLTPTEIDFGRVEVHTISDPVTVTLANTGRQPFEPSFLGVSTDFTSEDSHCQVLMNPGDSCDFEVFFNPFEPTGRDAGDSVAALIEGVDGQDAGGSVQLRGRVLSPLESCEDEVALLDADLGRCTMELGDLLQDSDMDGVVDDVDDCSGTVLDAETDKLGCSLAQFCGAFDELKKNLCHNADWKNDEPLGAEDCKSNAGLCLPRL